MMEQKVSWSNVQQRLFKMVSVGVIDDTLNKGYDIVSTGALVVNLIGAVLMTFDGVMAHFGTVLTMIEAVTVFFFAVDYVLRLLTADCLFPNLPPARSMLSYIFSFAGIIDILSFLPYYLPVFFPAGMAAFRLFRVARIFRLFRINAYYDSLNVITEVLYSKKQQLMSSVFIIAVLMIASSLCMYSLEHEAQPEVFSNAFSGIWWSVSTLLTVGYGDIYPITTAGQVFGILISFLGVGMVAIPTGIISAGFVEQYSRFKRVGDYAEEENIHFIKIQLAAGDSWAGKRIRELGLPKDILVVAILRGSQTIIPRGHIIPKPGDILVLGAAPLKNDQPIELKEIHLKHKHPWNGQLVRDIDISRQTFIVMVKRKDEMLLPNSELKLQEDDVVILYSKVKLEKERHIEF